MLGYLILIIGLVALGVQLSYITLIFSRLIFYKPLLPHSHSRSYPSVSVLIAARNEYDNLQKLLPVLFMQKYAGRFEIIVANDRSSDATEELLKNYQTQYPCLRYVNINQTPDGIAPKKYALMQAIAEARHDILLFTDADCVPSSAFWIEKMVESFNQKGIEVVLGISQYQKLTGFLNMFIRYETLQTAIQYLSFAIFLKPFMGVGRNLAYRKALFQKEKGFTEHLNVLSGDDDLFVNKVASKDNTAIVLDPDGQTISFPKTTLMDWYAQKKRHLSVGRRYKIVDQLLLGGYMTTLLIGNLCFLGQFFLQSDDLLFHAFGGGWMFRWIILAIVLCKIAQKIGKHNVDWESLLFLPIFDILYVFYWWIVGVASLNTRNITWKT